MAEPVSWAENPSITVGRCRANVYAAGILETATAEKRGVTEKEVLRVLRLWVVQENGSRKKEMPDGERAVRGEQIGLQYCSGGRLIATPQTRNYPKVPQLFARFLKDNPPDGATQGFPFTSIIVNQGIHATRHRDQYNFSATAIEAFGDFNGGRLRY